MQAFEQLGGLLERLEKEGGESAAAGSAHSGKSGHAAPAAQSTAQAQLQLRSDFSMCQEACL